jgi:hypothetical protein
MNVFAFTVPMPPSTNNLFATYNGRRIISRDYKAWRQIANVSIRQAWVAQGKPAFERHMALTIHVGLDYRGDISNRIKAIEDSIGEAVEGFPNDRYIDRVEIERVPGLDGARVMVTQLAPPDQRSGEARPIGEVIKPIMARVEQAIAERAA